MTTVKVSFRGLRQKVDLKYILRRIYVNENKFLYLKMIKRTLCIVCLFMISLFSYGQTLTSVTPTTFFQGQNYLAVKIYGTNLNYTSLTKRVYGVYLIHQLTNNLIAINDTSLYPNSPISANNDSITIHPQTYVPVTADLGVYDLMVISIGTFNPPGNYSYDTLFSAVQIINADGNYRGKIYHDKNLNGVYDNGDSATGNFNLYYDNIRAYNSQYDNSCNYYIPSLNGSHTISIVSVPPLVLFTDSSNYFRVINNSDVSNLDFGLTEGFYSVSPDTVNQSDSITFDLLSWYLFNDNFNGIEVRDSSFNLIDIIYGTTLIDTNHIQEQLVVSYPPGVYSLELTTVGGDIYPLNYSLVVLQGTNSINKLSSDKIWINQFSNPVLGDLVINKKVNIGDLDAKLYDLAGKVVAMEKVTSTRQIIPTSNLRPGLYLLKLESIKKEFQAFKVLLE